MATPSISVALASFEGERFIDAQLESIAAQSRPPDELIVCDDGSSDDTVERVRAFASRAPFAVRVEVNPARLGTTANFEKAASLCRGEFVLLADQDDLWRADKIDVLIGLLERRPEVGVVFSNGAVVNEALAPLGYDLWQALFFDDTDQRRVRSGEAPAVFARRVVAAGTTLAYRAHFAPLLHPFPDLPSTHDAWIAFMIAAVSECEIVPDDLIRYRLHGENQIGLKRFNLREQLAQARRQLVNGVFAREAAFFELARDRLAGGGHGCVASEANLRVIEEKIAHSRLRESMPDGWVSRLPLILREAANGGYRRYAYGWKSVAQDLFLR